MLSPVRKTTGTARWILLSGMLITTFFLVLAIFAPWIAPYGFAQTSSHGVDFPKLGPPSSAHWFGTTYSYFDVYSRVDLGKPHRP